MKKLSDEKSDAEKIYKDGLPSISRKNLYLLARYLREILKYGDVRVEKTIIEYCEKFESDFSSIASYELIQYAISSSKKTKRMLSDFDKVSVTQSEVLFVQKIKDFKSQTILLSMIIFEKVYHPNSKKFNVSIFDIRQILEISGLKMSLDKFIRDYYFLLKSENLITHRHNWRAIKINLEKKESDKVLFWVYELENIKKHYINYLGKEIFYCKICGKECERTGNIHVYCKECSSKIRKNKERDRQRGL